MITMKYVDNLTGRQFELFTGRLLKDLGFHKVKVTRPTGDHGLDVIAKDVMGKSIGVQCKHLGTGEYTGYKAIEEAFTGKAYYNTDKGILLTNRRITNNAIKSAKKPNINVKCWDREKLKDLILIANNISYMRPSKEVKYVPLHHKLTKSDKFFQSDFSLRDAKLISIISAKVIRSNYPKNITLNFNKIRQLLHLNKYNLDKAINQFIYVCKNSCTFAFHSTKLGDITGFISLFLAQPIIKDNQITININDCLIELLKGKPIKSLEHINK